jgi:ABC-2 type transport system permease protein
MSFCVITLFFFSGLLAYFTPNVTPVVSEIVSYFSIMEHMGEFSKGIIDSRRIVFYLSATFLMLTLTQQVFQYRRWKA